MNKLSNPLNLAKIPVPFRIISFLILLLIVWVPLGLPILWLVSDPDWQSILGLGLLYIEFMILVRWWGRSIHQETHPLRHYGLSWTKQNGRETFLGFSLGVLSLLSLYGLQGGLGWLTWQHPSPALARILLEGLAVALGVGFAEELVFRGWVLDELERDYGDRSALWINSVLFATVHFLKPWTEILRTLPQFPGLVLLGFILVSAKRRFQGRLGSAIGLHWGLVAAYYWIVVGELVRSTHQAPLWITGIDQNPLAGLLGLLFLTALALVLRPNSRKD
jgi:membrane protease YdiL (CAAX protease family)